MSSANPAKNRKFRVLALGHVNVTVSEEQEDAAKTFYKLLLGLKQIPKPAGPRQNIGAWYELGGVQLHLSVADKDSNATSEGHVCYVVADIKAAENHLRDQGTQIILDPSPMDGVNRFYVRDPGGNLIEITETQKRV